MATILKEFNDCTVFSLTYANKIKSIPQKDKENLLNTHLNEEKIRMQERYQYVSKTESNLPPFEKIFDEIYEECKAFYNNFKTKSFPSGFSPYICDHVGKDTKYHQPISLFWHIYHSLQNVIFSQDNLTELPTTDDFLPDQINDICLKTNFIKYEYTYQTHCTSGPLQLVFYFKLNKNTKQWLLKFKDDFALEGTDFEDLALYCNNQPKFSSCTHERFNSLTTEI